MIGVPQYTKMAITDLDGTLLRSDKTVSKTDRKVLEYLSSQQCLRVAATGRSLQSVMKVLEPSFPIDYLVFSSGSGVMNWKTKELLQIRTILANDVVKIANALLLENLDFSIQLPSPKNHYGHYHLANQSNDDFKARNLIYKDFLIPIVPNETLAIDASQFIIIEMANVDSKYLYLKEMFPNNKVVRATSPINHSSCWIEIFHKDVSKANGCAYIADMHNISHNNTLAVGNDFNDVDLLNWSASSYIVKNAHEDLKKLYTIVRSNNESAFSHAVSIGFTHEINQTKNQI